MKKSEQLFVMIECCAIRNNEDPAGLYKSAERVAFRDVGMQ